MSNLIHPCPQTLSNLTHTPPYPSWPTLLVSPPRPQVNWTTPHPGSLAAPFPGSMSHLTFPFPRRTRQEGVIEGLVRKTTPSLPKGPDRKDCWKDQLRKTIAPPPKLGHGPSWTTSLEWWGRGPWSVLPRNVNRRQPCLKKKRDINNDRKLRRRIIYINISIHKNHHNVLDNETHCQQWWIHGLYFQINSISTIHGTSSGSMRMMHTLGCSWEP